jgi:hypothetical protein
MSSFPRLVRFESRSDQVRYRLGERLADRYLELVELAVARRHPGGLEPLGRRLQDAPLAGVGVVPDEQRAIRLAQPLGCA